MKANARWTRLLDTPYRKSRARRFERQRARDEDSAEELDALDDLYEDDDEDEGDDLDTLWLDEDEADLDELEFEDDEEDTADEVDERERNAWLRAADFEAELTA